jgi:hypothetical protein
MIKTKNKRAQEEITGFVLVIVLVAVIFMILLGIMIRTYKPDTSSQSKEYSQFLGSMMEVTSDCVVYSPGHAKISDLIGYCLDSQQCVDGNTSCQTLNYTISTLLSDSIKYGPDRKIKGYSLSMVYETNVSGLSKSILSINKGVCNSTYVGAPYPLPHYPGAVNTKIKVCY